MIIENKKGELIVNRDGIYHVDYDKVTSYEGFQFVFGTIREVPSDYAMFEVSSGVVAVKKSECVAHLRGRLAEAMCNKFLLQVSNAKLPLATLVENAKMRVCRNDIIDAWKISLIGQPY